MKKVALSLAGLLAAAAFAPEASALPLFARQTGMACNACHFQHFPMLNGFGRSFKASAYTLMGAQGKVEGDGLSIPAELNAAILTTAGYTSTNAKTGPIAATTNTHGTGFFVPGTNGEFSLFVGGRISDFAGGLAELGFVGAGGLNQSKIVILPEVGSSGLRAGVTLFTTGSAGPGYGYEVLNTGAVATHTMLFVAGDSNGSIGGTLSAQQYVGSGAGLATGAGIVANNSMGFLNISKFHMVGPADLRAPAPGVSASLGSTYLRVAGTFDVAGWDTGVGVASITGASYSTAVVGGVLAGAYDTKATAIDGQMQGQVGAMPVGIYVTYATAPNVTGANGTLGNVYNNPGAATGNRQSLNIATEWGVIPEKVTVGAAIRRAKSGSNLGSGIPGQNDTDNAYQVNAGYKLAQNMLVQLVYTAQSGTFWSTANANNLGSKQVTVNLATIY